MKYYKFFDNKYKENTSDASHEMKINFKTIARCTGVLSSL